MKHYGKLFLSLGALWAAGMAVAAWGALAACSASDALEEASREALRVEAQAREAECAAEAEASRMPPVKAFLDAWAPHQRSQCDERELGLAIRSGLEGLAQRRLSLVTDQATTPEPCRLIVDGKAMRMQRVSLRASGESLSALVAWLGEAEALFPYARVEGWELTAAGGANSALRVMLCHPLVQESVGKKEGVSP